MRHRKRTVKLGRTGSHLKAMCANMVKSLVAIGYVETTVPKAKEVRRHAEHMVTLAKQGDLAGDRRAIQAMQVRYNELTPVEERRAKAGNTSGYNLDRFVMGKLKELAIRFAGRAGGYTRMVRTGMRRGDGVEVCLLEFLPAT